MSQNYTPVEWVDETTSQQGTLINKARLDQMQTAHHYADGFEEVDTIPTADPGVSYHKVVYCTADSTFYRWNGTAWAKDIDDDTKALLDQEIARAEHAEGLIQGYLDAHEANHNNPHQVTKAQVGLGNCDNTADLDKPISTAAQAALDTKADKATTLAGYGITDAVATGGAQTVGGVKTFTDNPLVSNGEPAITIKNTDVSVSGTPASTEGATIHFAGNDGEDLARIKMTKGSSGMTILRAYIHGPHGDGEAHLVSDSQDTYMTGPARAYNAANASDIMTIGVYKAQTDTLLATKADVTALTDGSVTKVGTADLGTDTKPIKLVGGVPTAVTNDLVSTSGAQTIQGTKTFYDDGYSRVRIKTGRTGATDNIGSLAFYDSADTQIMNIQPRNDGITNINLFGTTKALLCADQRDYNAANVADVVTIKTLDQYGPMVRTTGNQSIAGIKTYTSQGVYSYTTLRLFNSALNLESQGYDLTNPPAYATRTINQVLTGTNLDQVASRDELALATGGNSRSLIVHSRNGDTDNSAVFMVTSFKDGTSCMRGPSRAYNPANTTDVATIGTLDAYSPMVRTSGNQEKAGILTLSTANQYGTRLALKSGYSDRTSTTESSSIDLDFTDKNNELEAKLFISTSTAGRKLTIRLYKTDGTYSDTTLASVNF